MNRLTALIIAGAFLSACGDDSTSPGGAGLAGQTFDFFTTGVLSSVDLSLEGTALTDTSTASGHFAFPTIPTDSALTVLGQHANYMPTRSERLLVHRGTLSVSLRLVSIADLDRQFTATGQTREQFSTAVFVDLVDDTGAPRANIPLANIFIRDNLGTSLATPPHIVGATGDIDINLTQTQAFNGRTRVIFLEVPTGFNRVTVFLPGGITTIEIPIHVVGGQVTLARG